MSTANSHWQVAPVLGVPNVRQAAEYYREVLGFHVDPEHGVFQPVADEPGGVYGIVDREGVRVHLQIRRGAKVQAPKRAPYGIRECEVEDHKGYRLTFGEVER